MRSSRVVSLLAVAAGLALGAGRADLAPGGSYLGEETARTWRAGEVAHLYRFPLAAGQFVRIAAEQRSSDVKLEVLAPGDDEPTVADGITYATGTDAFELIANASGEARVRIVALEAIGDAPGYRLTISAPRPAGPRERLRAATFAEFERARKMSGEASVPVLERALRLAERSRSPDLQAGIHDLLGRRLPGDDPAALKHLRAAVTLADEPQVAGTALHKLGFLLAAQNPGPEVGATFHEELRLAVRSGDRFREAIALGDLAWLAKRGGGFGEAIARDRQALAIWRRIGDRKRQAQTLSDLAGESLDLGDPEQAEADLKAGLALDFVGPSLRVDLLDNLALAFRRMEDWDRARATSAQALAAARRLRDREREASCLLTLASMELDQKRTRPAVAYLKQAERILLHEVENPSYLANTEVMLGVAAGREGKFPEAFERFARSVDGYLRLGDESARAWVLSHRSDALRQAGRRDEARADLEQAIAILESLRPALEPQKRAELVADRHRFFERLVDLLVEQGKPRAAFEASERSRARTLLDEVSGQRVTPPRSLVEIQAALPPGYVLLDYWLGETRSMVWAVGRERLSLVLLPEQKQIEEQAGSAALALGTPPGTIRKGERDRKVALLAQTLFGPIADRLVGERFVIVPDGALFAVPFAALPIPGSAAADPERLIDRGPVVTLPSASLALEIRDAVARRPAADGGLFALGDPVFGCPDARLSCPDAAAKAPLNLSDRFGARLRAFLPSAKEKREATGGALPRIARTGSEVTAISRLAGGRATERLGFAANRNAVLESPLERYRILHFATHGLADPVRPVRSGLALARWGAAGSPLSGDTFLRLGDLAGRRLRAELVVLSACDSAIGKETRGEGPQSLGRAFLAAGAANALVSLWRVDDSSTEELMVGFYRQLLEQGHSAATALSRSQLAVRSRPEWSDPYYWGAFVLQGDWRDDGAITEKGLNETNGEVSFGNGMSRAITPRRLR